MNKSVTIDVTPNVCIYKRDNFGIYKFYSRSPHEYLRPIKKSGHACFGDEKASPEDAVYYGTMLGDSQELEPDCEYTLTATTEYSAKYKEHQFKIKQLVPKKPQSKQDSLRFLCTIISPSQAQTLLEAYPNVVEDVIGNDAFEPDYKRLKGIKQKTFERIKDKIRRFYSIGDLLILLQPLGVTMTVINKLVKKQPNVQLLKQQILDNPYQLLDLYSAQFGTVDNFAIKLNPEFINSIQRAAACVKYVLFGVGNSQGHTWIERSRLIDLVRKRVPECKTSYKKMIDMCFDDCRASKPSFLYVDENRVGLYRYYNAERSIAKKLQALANCQCLKSGKEHGVDFDSAIQSTNLENGFELTFEQTQAVKSVIENNVTIITGAAGTGKTAITKAIINLFKDRSIALCALSAKAARRMTESCGMKSYTIHRLLGWSNGVFEYGASNPLNCDLFIIDEASMIDVHLFDSLLKAIPLGAKVVIIFDFAQLSPIGVGNVAFDLLESNLPIYKFTKIHRQAEKSGILVDANKIRVGQSPVEEFQDVIVSGELKDMVYYFHENAISSKVYEALHRQAIEIYEDLLKDGVDPDDIVIITPRKSSLINSVSAFNNEIQDIVLPEESDCIVHNDTSFKLGAKVMQKVNDYDNGVVNGETGIICEITKTRANASIGIAVDFGGDKIVKYALASLKNIDLAYASSVHAYQGSQIKYVIVVIDMSHMILLDNCLFYTAVTRASKKCYCVAQPKAFIYCLANNHTVDRQTFLKEFLAK